MQAIAVRAWLLAVLSLPVAPALAEGDAPPALGALAGKDLTSVQDRLTGWNYEIVHSTLAGGNQHWWNNAAESCVLVKFDAGRTVTAVSVVAPRECRDYARQAPTSPSEQAGEGQDPGR